MSDLLTQLQATLGTAYALDRELGGGGMARVFLARETALGRMVVVKVIAPDLAEGVSGVRFTREVKLAARLQQANIVPVLTAGEAGRLPYYTMPFVEGQSLRARIAEGPVPLGDALSILRDVARALAYAHRQDVVHRDIKPDNILLSGGAAVVTDFGIAKALSASRTIGDDGGDQSGTLTQAGGAIGTPAYMAPEQAAGGTVDARTDLYAWGVVAYEVLSGAHPFAARHGAQQLIAAHLAELPAPLGPKVPALPDDLVALVMQTLEKDPQLRPVSADEVVTRLSSMTTPSLESRVRTRPRSAGRWLGPAVIVLAVLLYAGWRGLSAPAAPAVRTVVVIPFDNLGAPTDAYFADGVSEEIASQLARIPGLQVIARASVLRFRGSGKSPREIGTELGAAYALNGTVRWARVAGSRKADGEAQVRIVPALIEVATGTQIWGEAFQQQLTDVFAVQADVAERVAAALSITLGSADLAAMRRPESRNPEARDAQLLGRSLLRQRGLDPLRRAVVEFRRAIALDSTYARAWAGYSEAFGYLPTYGDTTVTNDEAITESERAARRAVALDSLLSDAHLALATALEHGFRFNEGLAAARRAVALDPGSPLALKEEGLLLLALGRVAEAGPPMKRAAVLDPLVPPIVADLGSWYAAAGFPDSASRLDRRAIDLDPSTGIWQFALQINSGTAGHLEEAVAACTRFSGREALCRSLWSGVLLPGHEAAGLAALDQLGTDRGPMTLSPVEQAWFYARLGRPDSAFARLARGIAERSPLLYAGINHPWFAPLRSDPRWTKIVGAVQQR